MPKEKAHKQREYGFFEIMYDSKYKKKNKQGKKIRL